jgi:CheY-like chemotaxis protein
MMHGDIGISSDPENGTVFWFSARLPLPHKNEHTPHSNRAAVLQGKHLLVIDEHLPFCDLVTSLTTSWGMVTDISHQFADAEQKLKKSAQEQNPYDLVILPWQARSEADETLHKALSEGQFGYKPTLIGSIHSRYLQSETPKSAGFSKFLTKPVTSKQLHNTLAESLGAVIQNTDNEPQQPAYHYTKLRVLVAEDNKVNMMVIEGLLNKLHIQPVCAHNGEEALTRYESATEPFDLILMDCEMPKVDGYDASKLIRQYEQEHQQPRTLIVALSAHTTPEYKEKAFAAGMDDYITKPVSKEQIEKILDQHFPQTPENPANKVSG